MNNDQTAMLSNLISNANSWLANWKECGDADALSLWMFTAGKVRGFTTAFTSQQLKPFRKDLDFLEDAYDMTNTNKLRKV